MLVQGVPLCCIYRVYFSFVIKWYIYWIELIVIKVLHRSNYTIILNLKGCMFVLTLKKVSDKLWFGEFVDNF